MSMRHNRKQTEELSTQAGGEAEPIQGLTSGELTDPPSTSVDPQQSPEVLAPEHLDELHAQAQRPQTVPRCVQSPLRASGPANQGLDSPRSGHCLGHSHSGSIFPRGIDQRSESGQNLGDAPSDPDCVSPDEGDMEEEGSFTIPTSEIVLTEAMEATERLNTVFNCIRTSMNRMSLWMKELFIVPVTKSSGKTIEPGNNQAHDKAAAKAATE
ncbi:hypothetical protein M422DRAFT_264024 [Sphaerobolus stellatus SS14]|uniref:Unplaced genomic scaffold SPHSTscaffold_131, whole genome shotgun sequence n=1 Tax=Sphaerobolus stellatus (strain SS14) TaxID=990650 RepID=A0A0C9UX89_SPHS4|nr:hypothetical protein M422DRAFT_264024 [Sphaerobolus stellatus SS14]